MAKSSHDDGNDQLVDALDAARYPLENVIRSTSPTTVAGCAVKLRDLQRCFMDGDAPGAAMRASFGQVLACLDRLASGAPA